MDVSGRSRNGGMVREERKVIACIHQDLCVGFRSCGVLSRAKTYHHSRILFSSNIQIANPG